MLSRLHHTFARQYLLHQTLRIPFFISVPCTTFPCLGFALPFTFLLDNITVEFLTVFVDSILHIVVEGNKDRMLRHRLVVVMKQRYVWMLQSLKRDTIFDTQIKDRIGYRIGQDIHVYLEGNVQNWCRWVMFVWSRTMQFHPKPKLRSEHREQWYALNRHKPPML